MLEGSPAPYRRIWPFEGNKRLNFIGADDREVVDADAREAYDELFDHIFSDDLEDVAPECTPNGSRTVNYLITTDACSHILIEFTRFAGDQMSLSQILIQDRLLGKVRNEYGYYYGDTGIVRVCNGDIAAQMSDSFAGIDTIDEQRSDSGQPVDELELITLGTLVLVKGVQVFDSEENGTKPLCDLLITDSSVSDPNKDTRSV